jgi:hypothetical protein
MTQSSELIMTDLELALSDSALPADLARLASSRVVAVRRAVAANPNTPEAALERLAALEPEAFLTNPALELFRFLNPAFFENLPSFARHALLASEACPPAWLERAGSDELSALAALRNPNLSPALLTAWLHQVSSAVDDAIAHHVSFTDDSVSVEAPSLGSDLELFKDALVAGIALDADTLTRLAEEYDSDLRALVAANPHGNEALRQQLAFDDDEVVRVAALGNAHLPASVRELAQRAETSNLRPKERELLVRVSGYGRLLVAKHRNLPQTLLRRLARDDDWRVRQAIAAHMRTPPKVLQSLAKDSDRDVREAVARNSQTPAESLEHLLADNNDAVRLAARSNKNAPRTMVELLERLEQRDPTLRDLARLPAWMNPLVAAHPNAPEDLLERFAEDDDLAVVVATASNSSTPQKVLERLCAHAQSDVLMALARNTRLSLGRLTTLAKSQHHHLREVVALHPNLSQALLEELGRDSHWEVRRAVALHGRCPTHLLEQLCQDADADVAFSAVQHRHASNACAVAALGVEIRLPETLIKIKNHDSSLESGWLEFVARRGNDAAKRLVASHPNLSNAVLEWLATHASWQVRLQVAHNSALADALLIQLAEDSDTDVREAVARHPNTPLRAVELLAVDGQVSVRQALVSRFPPVMLDAMAWDDDPELRSQATISTERLELRERLERGAALTDAEIAQLQKLAAPWALGLLAANQSFKNLEFFVTHSDFSLREAVLQNPHVGLTELERLVDDAESAVRFRVALHAKTPHEFLLRLLRDEDLNVRRAALSNPNLESNTRVRAQRFILDECLRSSSLNRIVALERTERLPELRKRKNARSLEWRERLAVAKNPNTPHAVLEKLARDANRLVRLKAQTRLGSS